LRRLQRGFALTLPCAKPLDLVEVETSRARGVQAAQRDQVLLVRSPIEFRVPTVSICSAFRSARHLGAFLAPCRALRTCGTT